MKLWEAMRALEEGKKVRCVDWALDQYVYKSCSVSGVSCEGNARLLTTGIGSLFNIEWELYKEPVKTYTFQEIIPFLKEGKKVGRLSGSSILVKGDNTGFCLTFKDVESNDWIVLE